MSCQVSWVDLLNYRITILTFPIPLTGMIKTAYFDYANMWPMSEKLLWSFIFSKNTENMVLNQAW